MGDEELNDGLGEDEAGGLPAGGISSGRSKIVTILIWVVGAIVAITLMILISYFIARKVKSESFQESQGIVIAPAPAPLSNFKFQKEFRVNTADIEEPHFISVSISLAYEGENLPLDAELAARIPQMMHTINIILGSKRKEELFTSDQKLDLAEEIKSQLNMILREGKIEEVYFEQLVVS